MIDLLYEDRPAKELIALGRLHWKQDSDQILLYKYAPFIKQARQTGTVFFPKFNEIFALCLTHTLYNETTF